MSASLILESIFGISFKGYVLMVIAGGSLLVIAYLALGAFLQLLVRDLPTGLAMGDQGRCCFRLYGGSREWTLPEDDEPIVALRPAAAVVVTYREAMQRLGTLRSKVAQLRGRQSMEAY
jgi:hypothetical protein